MPPCKSRKAPGQISLFDIFVGTGRTIRHNKGPPGLPLLQTNFPLEDSKPAAKKSQYDPQKHTKLNASTNKDARKTGAKGDDQTNGAVKADTKKAENSNSSKDKTNSDEEKKNKHTAADAEKIEDDSFTPAQDAKLLEMKAANKTWKDIEEAIGKPKHIAQPRFKELQAKGDAGKAEGGNQVAEGAEKNEVTAQGKDGDKAQADTAKTKGVDGQAKSKESDTQTKQQQGKEKGKHKGKQQGQEQQQAGAKTNTNNKGGRGGSSTELKFSLSQLQRLEDSHLSLADLQHLVKIAGVGTQPDWDVVASKFFDKTGRRIDGQDIEVKMKLLQDISREA